MQVVNYLVVQARSCPNANYVLIRMRLAQIPNWIYQVFLGELLTEVTAIPSSDRK